MTEKDQEYEDQIKRNALLLQKYLKEGRIKLPYSPELKHSLLACRYGADGEVDLNTVDATVRCLALMAGHMEYQDKCRDLISLKEIQDIYFTFIYKNFSYFYDMMVKSQATPHQIATAAAYGKCDFHDLLDKLDDFLIAIVDFWEHYSASAYIHVEDSYDTLKGVFGGELFPTENIASKCGIYLDTIVLPCPFIRSKSLFPRWSDKKKIYYLIKHALNILSYRNLILADTDLPIVVILPDKEMLYEVDRDYVMSLGERDALFHSGKLFGRNFSSIEELFDYAKRFDTVEKVIANVKDKKRILFDAENAKSIEEQFIEQVRGESGQLLGTNHPGLILAGWAIGRMDVCNEILIKSLALHGTPVIDAPTSWEYFKWKMEYDAERTYHDQAAKNLHIVKGLQHLGDTPLQWIGKVPPEALIELRKTGAINEIRSILAKGIDELISTDHLNFTATSHQVFNNLNSAFIQHKKNIEELKAKKWKVAGTDFGSWLVMGSIEIASACIGTPLYGVSTAILNQIIDAPKLKDLPKSINKIKDIQKNVALLKKSPVGLMFNYHP